MADEKKEKRNLLDDIQKNIIDKIGNENIMEGDITRYKIPEKLPEVPIKTIERSKKKVIENESEFEKAFNYGMQKAKGDYFLILDSDCILPSNYLKEVTKSLNDHYVDCFGGPDAAHESFTSLQKAINFSMTSFITTGGIRGHKKSVDTFQPRSFNMGLSKGAFEASKGFGNFS